MSADYREDNMLDSRSNEYTALPPGGAGPGVLVLHAWWGLTGFVRQVCDRLAAEGYVALAPDLFDGEIATTVAEAELLIGRFDGQATEAKVAAALDRLQKHPAVHGERAGVMGFSFGAYYALWLAEARSQDVAAVVVFYGTSGLRFSEMQAACLGHYAERDPYEPAEGVQDEYDRVKAAGGDVTFYTYPGTGHWFFEQDRPDAYDPQAAELAWQRTTRFLQETLGAVD
jgi:carboxymethylenebutenolidase